MIGESELDDSVSASVSASASKLGGRFGESFVPRRSSQNRFVSCLITSSLYLSLSLSLSLSRSSYFPMLPARLVLRRIASLKSFCSVKSICSAILSYASVCGRKINTRAIVNFSSPINNRSISISRPQKYSFRQRK